MSWRILQWEAGAIPLLVNLLSTGTEDAKTVAAGALSNLARDRSGWVAIGSSGAIPLLVGLLDSGADMAKGNAASDSV